MAFRKVQRVKVKFLHFAFLIVTLASVVSMTTAQSTGDGPAKKSSTVTSQTPADQPVTTMSVQVKVVNVFATARDKHGKIVNGLGKDDFTLTEDGRPQTIRYFARETDLPLTLGLLVDTSMSQRRVLGQERSASQSFLNQMVREDQDKAFVIHFDRDVELLQDLTSSHEKLEAALQSLEAPQFNRTSGGNSPGGRGGSDPNSGRGPGRGSGRRQGGGTMLYDAVYLASDELMQKQQGARRWWCSPTASTPAAGRVWRRRSNPRNAPTPWSIPSCSRMTKPMAMVEVLAEPGSAFRAWVDRAWAAEEWEVAGAAGADIRSSTPTARKSWSGYQRRQGGGCLKSPRKSPSIRFILKSRKSCAISTASATPQIEAAPRSRAITRFRSRQSRKTSSCKPERGTTGTSSPKLQCVGRTLLSAAFEVDFAVGSPSLECKVKRSKSKAADRSVRPTPV